MAASADTPPVLTTAATLKDQVQQWKSAGLRVGLVPTMGALHHGHLSLVQAISQHVDRVIVSIFVNPTQFGAGEDLDSYPRQLEADLSSLQTTDCHLVFAPTADQIYPDGFATTVRVGGLSEVLEGANRPGHFDGVATVVSKLLMISQCDAAIFGEKDFQQLAVIRRFVRDLNMPVDIIGGKLVREVDGLAASSRNAYLSASQRQIAGQFNLILKDCLLDIKGGMTVDHATEKATKNLLDRGFTAVDYVALVDPDSLQKITSYTPPRPAQLLAVARLGSVRLLDNMAL